MRYLALLVAFLSWALAHAADVKLAPASQKPSLGASANRTEHRIKAVTSAAPGQAGYVHYFLLTHPDGSREYHVGIELSDQRIAWAFPTAGVMVSDYIRRGALDVNGKSFHIKHLYGIRPAARDADMPALQKNLTARVAQWVDDATPYCVFRQPGEPFCLNCGDFIVRVLYPGAHPLVPELPGDFARAKGGGAADDLLLYLVGLHEKADKSAMLATLATLDLPKALRTDIAAMMEGRELEGENPSPTAIAARPTATPAPPNPPASRIATRRAQAKKI
jgi:hypothetical protein